ncbi:hypothetical protein Golax_011779, partial [Gossypium laxum]|nr:hypothetical protein [Gossypium laxum]
ISGCKADTVIAKLGFDNSFRVEAFGFTGGFWILWNDDIGVEILNVHSQFIYMRIWVIHMHISFLCTIVYASRHCSSTAQLWDKLSEISTVAQEPWLIVGDFIANLSGDEQKGGSDM